MEFNLNHNPLSHFFNKHKDMLLKHKDKLIWFHSFYALLIGIGVMWLGSKNFKFIRFAFIQILFIWLSNLAIPLIHNHPKLSSKWKERIRLVINYFNRNFYQGLLFFILPIYYMSATMGSKNMVFIVLVAISAILSTMDIVYDRYISVQAIILSLFFAFNLFACINIMLPILWGVRTVHSVRFSAILAFIGFATFCFRLSHIENLKKKIIIGAAAVMFFFISESGRAFIPPAPLKLDKTEFGQTMKKRSLEIGSLYSILPEGTARIYSLTYLKAPLKMKEKVNISWYLNGDLISSSKRSYEITGKGEKGRFRLWWCKLLKNIPPASTLMVEAETEDGQLIGRSFLSSK
ncbi:MAG: DUF5924 family protein [Candidatus Omnitrophota bacterium]